MRSIIAEGGPSARPVPAASPHPRLDRITAATSDQLKTALMFLSVFSPDEFDHAMDVADSGRPGPGPDPGEEPEPLCAVCGGSIGIFLGVDQLPWSLVATLLDSCPDRETAEFYAQRTATERWTRPVLQSMIAGRLHERSQPALTSLDRAVPEPDRDAVREIVKDPFVLDFLAADPVRERDLSKALTDNLARFLRELGTGFAFVGAEVPIRCGDREFFLDLLFYHCKLYRYVVLELKLGRFEPEYVGKLNFYVQLVDDHLRNRERDEPTLGLLLVVGRDDVTVEVALRGVSTPLAVTEWRRLPAKVRQALPSAEDLSATVSRTVREVESSTAVATP